MKKGYGYLKHDNCTEKRIYLLFQHQNYNV